VHLAFSRTSIVGILVKSVKAFATEGDLMIHGDTAKTCRNVRPFAANPALRLADFSA